MPALRLSSGCGRGDLVSAYDLRAVGPGNNRTSERLSMKTTKGEVRKVLSVADS